MKEQVMGNVRHLQTEMHNAPLMQVVIGPAELFGTPESRAIWEEIEAAVREADALDAMRAAANAKRYARKKR